MTDRLLKDFRTQLLQSDLAASSLKEEVDFLRRRIHQECHSPESMQERVELKDKLEFIDGVVEMYKKTEHLYKSKEVAIYLEFENSAPGPRKDQIGQVFEKMTEHLKAMEVQMFKLVGVENSWYQATVQKFRHLVTEYVRVSAAGVSIFSGMLAGVFWIVDAFTAAPIHHFGFLPGLMHLLGVASAGLGVGAAVGSVVLVILYYCWTADVLSPVTENAQSHIQDVKRMAEILEQVPNDAFCQKLDEMIVLTDKLTKELPDHPDRLCCICLETGNDVIAPVRSRGCQGHHYMCHIGSSTAAAGQRPKMPRMSDMSRLSLS